jgi:hypothetical protein
MVNPQKNRFFFEIINTEYLLISGDIREDYGIHRVEGTFWILDQSKN